MTQVTKQWLAAKVAVNPSLVIGRALVAIFRNQTEAEKTHNVTRLQNGIGFTQADARIGCLGAKYFLKYGRLEDWQLKIWNGLNRKGEIRILKYAGQLNQIAKVKQQSGRMTGFQPAQQIPKDSGQKIIADSLTFIMS